MAKAPDTIDRIGFYFETSIDEAGKFIAMLTKEGVQAMRHELITDVITFKKGAHHAISAEAFLTNWIADHPTFKVSEAVKFCKEDGRTAGACYTALRLMVEKKVLKKLGEGNYARADVKSLAPPKKKPTEKKAAAKKGAKPHKSFEKTGMEVIMSYAKRNHGRCNTAKLLDLFEAEGRARNSVYAPLEKLVKAKKLKRVGEEAGGQFMLMNDQANGNGAVPVVEAANG